MKTLQKIHVGVMLTILLLLIAFLVWFYVRCTGPSNVEIKAAVESEADSLRSHVAECSGKVAQKVDSRVSDIEKGMESLDAKLDRIEAKLDRLTRLVNPPMPDGLKRAEDSAR